MKDYYKTLGIAPAAGAAEIKAAYRMLAAKYHPDKAVDNPFAEAHFKEISEAYRTLSEPRKRQAYDEERWLLGISSRGRIPVSPAWLLSEAERLEAHMRQIDTYRMNPAALRDYVLLLLSDEHLSMWETEATAPDRARLITLLLAALRPLRPARYHTLVPRLLAVAGGDAEAIRLVETSVIDKRRKARAERLLPWAALLIAIFICLAILYFSKMPPGGGMR